MSFGKFCVDNNSIIEVLLKLQSAKGVRPVLSGSGHGQKRFYWKVIQVMLHSVSMQIITYDFADV